jgi:hypothetical protein
MRVLMLDEGVGLGGLVESDLVDAGHEVVRCHPWGQPVFPCVGLLDRELCPLEHESVGVAVKVTGATTTCPGHHEEGVVCSLRRRVPLVLAGSPPDPRLVDVASAITPGHENVVHVVERVVDADITDLSTAARSTALAVLENHQLPRVDVTARVIRRDNGIIARLETDEDVPASIREVAAIKVHAALKRRAPDAGSVSVSVVPAG